jgi:hypothetical protein
MIIYSNKLTKPDTSISQIYCLSFKYSSICFGHPHAHHEELIDCSSRLWFTYACVLPACLAFINLGFVNTCMIIYSNKSTNPDASISQIYCLSFNQTDHDQPTLLPPRSNGKPEAAIAVDKLLMMGMRMPETCWAVFKRQTKNLRDWCTWLVDLFEYMMMHGLTNPKFKFRYNMTRITGTHHEDLCTSTL